MSYTKEKHIKYNTYKKGLCVNLYYLLCFRKGSVASIFFRIFCNSHFSQFTYRRKHHFTMSQSLYGWQTKTTPLTLFYTGSLGIVFCQVIVPQLSSFFFLCFSKQVMVISPNQSYLPNYEGNASNTHGKLGKIGLTDEEGGGGVVHGWGTLNVA